MTQLELRLPPAAAKRDPWTSHRAARNIDASGARVTRAQRAAALVRQHPGLTCRELAKAAELDRHELQKGLSDAVTALLVVKGAERECDITGNECVTWWPKL